MMFKMVLTEITDNKGMFQTQYKLSDDVTHGS